MIHEDVVTLAEARWMRAQVFSHEPNARHVRGSGVVWVEGAVRIEPGQWSLDRIPEADLLRRPMTPMARVTLWALRAQRVGHTPELLEAWAPELEEARRSAGQEALRVFFIYLGEVDRGAELLAAILDAPVDDNVRGVAMGIRKQWEDAAEARGESRGEARGEARGRAETLL